MPTVIQNTFALPDFRSSDYSVLLIYDKKIAKKFKDEQNSDKIAIVTLEDSIVKDVKFVSTQEEFVAEL
jgi:hypothetical protein